MSASAHDVRVLPDAAAAADAAAEIIASALNEAIDARHRASLAVSGGASPRPMFARLAELGGRSLGTGSAGGVDWDLVQVFQVDERVAPEGDPDRNLGDLRRELTDRCVPVDQVHPMPVELGAHDAAQAYAGTLAEVLGTEPSIDVVHLGIGDDGHTASLVPGDPVLHVEDRDVAATGVYQGRERVTLTYPALARAGVVVWLVVDEGKAEALARLVAGDRSIPAGRVRCRRSIVVADAAAAALLSSC
ncbi:MAG: 6-phosphogluconolactonase [Microthrixaceae bacterium]